MEERILPEEMQGYEEGEEWTGPEEFRPIYPGLARASGLYEWNKKLKLPNPVQKYPISRKTPVSGVSPTPSAETGTEHISVEDAHLNLPFYKEELRLDVDGRYPQMTASGTSYMSISSRYHWIAKLIPVGWHKWRGQIWYKDGDVVRCPYTSVDINVSASLFPANRTASIRLYGGGAPDRHITLKYKSAYFHKVEFEYDRADNVPPDDAVTNVNTCAHPNRPATMACETLSIEDVYRRAGFGTTKSAGCGTVPMHIAHSNANPAWNDAEMHDAMQSYWSRFANIPQWSMWTFFASMHEAGSGLGGIMFDDIGPNHRQGTAVFEHSFISQIRHPGETHPGEWVRRMRFWTAVHEMGHSFNLAHSWQKSLTVPGAPWIPLADEPEARSFMNYPYSVPGGQKGFFSDFEYRFSDQELLFMRHAPARFVQMGYAHWFDQHGFEQANVSQQPKLRLELRANRAKYEFEFMEPVVLELKLTNVTDQPIVVDERILSGLEHMTVIISKQGKTARQYLPYSQQCCRPRDVVLNPEASMYESLFVSAGKNGWDLAEPGNYKTQVALHMEGEDIVSNPIRVTVRPPLGYDEEHLAQDFFSDDVGRILAFDGSRFLEKGNDVLRETESKLNGRRVAFHARIALAAALKRDYKMLEMGEPRDILTTAADSGGKVVVRYANFDESDKLFNAALTEQKEAAAETLGHIDYNYYTDMYCQSIQTIGRGDHAAWVMGEMANTLAARGVPERILQGVRYKSEGFKEKKAA